MQILISQLFISAVPSLFVRKKLADQLNICIKGFNPVLFNFRASRDTTWVEALVAISGRICNRVDGTDLMAAILLDGCANHGEESIIIPMRAVLQDEGNTINHLQLPSCICFRWKRICHI